MALKLQQYAGEANSLSLTSRSPAAILDAVVVATFARKKANTAPLAPFHNRDYERVGKSLLNEDEERSRNVATEKERHRDVRVKVTVNSITETSIDVSFAMRKKTGHFHAPHECETLYRDYVVLVPKNLPDEQSAVDYTAFEFCFDINTFEPAKFANEVAVEGQCQLSLTSPSFVGNPELECRLVCNATGRVLGRSDPFVLSDTSSGSNRSSFPVYPFTFLKEGFDAFIEVQTHIRCFNIFLKSSGSAPAGLASLQEENLSLEEEPSNRKRFSLINGPASDGDIISTLTVPFGIVTSCNISISASKDYINLRLGYEDDRSIREYESDSDSFMSRLEAHCSEKRRSKLEDLNRIECRFCGHPFLADGKSLKRSLQLPEGFWDEISDFLVCHATTMVNFHSGSWEAVKECALENEAMVLLHSEDCGDRVGLSFADGYGEEDKKFWEDGKETEAGEGSSDEQGGSESFGEKRWKSGGATVWCNRCCSVVGFASLDFPGSLRLYKHRIVLGQGDDMKIFTEEHGVHSFIAREMVRFADTSSVYVFVGVCGSRRLVLKLLNWDSAACGGCIKGFKKVAKVLWASEEGSDSITAGNQSGAGDFTSTANLFAWADSCCVNQNCGGGSASSASKYSGKGALEVNGKFETEATGLEVKRVKLFLSIDEFEELHNSLELHRSFPEEVENSVLHLQNFTKNSGKGGLSLIPLM